MLLEKKEILNSEINSEELHEIITAVPSWILRRGITIVFLILLLIFAVSGFIQYPDIIKTSLKINSLNAPKSIYVKQVGKLIKLLVHDGDVVKKDQPLAFMESSGNHDDIIKLHLFLTSTISEVSTGGSFIGALPVGLNLGELQQGFENFYQDYLEYTSSLEGGYYLHNKEFLIKDLKEISHLKEQLIIQRNIQQQEYTNIKQEYFSYKKLYQNKVISANEFRIQENKYLSGQYPLQQNSSELLLNNTAYLAKQKEILVLEHTILQNRTRFLQALKSLITQTNTWMNTYVLSAPLSGTVNYVNIIQENQNLKLNQEVFIVNPANTNFFGEIEIPQYNMGKIKLGEVALIKMKSFPFEQFGLIHGKIDYVSDVAYNDSVFTARVSFDNMIQSEIGHKIKLKNGMLGDAEIVTERNSLLKRFLRNIHKMLSRYE